MTTTTLPRKFHRSEVVAQGVEDGIEWFTYNAPLWGAINGYARIPEGHPWRGLNGETLDVKVNGGVTFDSDNWIGFDTLHSGDYWPGVPHGPHDYDTHWTAEMVANEAKALARQIAAATR
jgi:hypothetical protein